MEKPVAAILLSILGVTISTADIMFGFQFVALAVPTAYAAWKWRQDYIKTQKKRNASIPLGNNERSDRLRASLVGPAT